MVVGAACFFYFALNAMTLVRLSTRIETVHVIIGVVGILILMELCRRCVGLPYPVRGRRADRVRVHQPAELRWRGERCHPV